MSLRRHIQFQFDFEKFLHLVLHLAVKVQGLDVLKLMKLIYFIDKSHLTKYGRSITGDVYYRLDYGPVPSLSYDLIKTMSDEYQVEEKSKTDREILLDNIEIDKSHPNPIYVAKHGASLDIFADSEIETINAVILDLGGKSSIELMNLSHEDATHKKTPLRRKIDYYLFFEDNPTASHDAL